MYIFINLIFEIFEYIVGFLFVNTMKEIRYPRDFSQSTLNKFQATFRQGVNVMWVAVVHKVLYCYCLKISGKKSDIHKPP